MRDVIKDRLARVAHLLPSPAPSFDVQVTAALFWAIALDCGWADGDPRAPESLVLPAIGLTEAQFLDATVGGQWQVFLKNAREYLDRAATDRGTQFVDLLDAGISQLPKRLRSAWSTREGWANVVCLRRVRQGDSDDKGPPNAA